jgi:hypothetical protein
MSQVEQRRAGGSLGVEAAAAVMIRSRAASSPMRRWKLDG